MGRPALSPDIVRKMAISPPDPTSEISQLVSWAVISPMRLRVPRRLPLLAERRLRRPAGLQGRDLSAAPGRAQKNQATGNANPLGPGDQLLERYLKETFTRAR